MRGQSCNNFSDFKYLFIVLILLFMPYSIRYTNYAVITFVLFTITITIRDNRDFIFFKETSFWIPFSYLIITLVGLIHTSNLGAGLRAVEVQASLLAFPFIFSQLGIQPIEFKRIKFTFIILLLILCLFLEFRIVRNMLNSGYDLFTYFFSYDYTYENLTTEFVVQPVYIGTYIVLSNIFCLSLFISEKHKIKKYQFVLILLFNTFFLFQLSARSSIILNALLISSYLIIIFYHKRKLYVGFIIIGIIFAGIIMLFNSSSFTRIRMVSFIEEITNDNLKEYDPKSRMLIWPCAVEVIGDNIIVGVGTGDSEDKLQTVYKKRELIELYNAGLNAHNQYLTLFMRHGLLGLIILILNFIIPLYFYLKCKNVEGILFTFLLMGFFLTENVLSRAQGVVFYAFFYSIFLVMTFDTSRDENTFIRN